MEFQSLAQAGLSVSKDEIDSVLAPFVTQRFEKGDDADWRRETARRKLHILGKALGRAVLPWRPETRRRKESVLDEYEPAWQNRAHDYYNIGGAGPSPTPWQWGEKRFFALDTGATRFRQLLLSNIIERVEPANVLEVGCGNGINLVLLASHHADVQFSGVELTSSGCRVAKALQNQGQLPSHLLSYAPLPVADAEAFTRIDFVQGNAAELPFPDGAFDLVCTILSLEQMGERTGQGARGDCPCHAQVCFDDRAIPGCE